MAALGGALFLLGSILACTAGSSAGRVEDVEPGTSADVPPAPLRVQRLEPPEFRSDPEIPRAVDSCYVGDRVDDTCVVLPSHRRALLPPAMQRDLALARCLDEEFGPFLDAWRWEPDEAERAVLAHDLDSDATFFGLLSDFEGTSILFRVREAETRTSLAVVKTNSSNTNTSAEVFAYRLSEALGFDGLVPECSPVELEGGALEKLLRLLRETTYRDELKEANRQRVVRALEQARADGEPYVGAIKPWLGAFMFVGELGDRQRLAASAVMRHLRANGPRPGDDDVELRQHTRLYEPRGTHTGRISMRQLARDVSNLLLMDAVMGQVDRYAGANVHFRAVDGERRDTGQMRLDAPVWDLGRVRVLALDNGASLKASGGGGFRDLTGGNLPELRVERFDPSVIARLRGIAGRTMGRGCDAFDPDERVAVWTWLGLTSEEEFRRAEANLERTLDYIDDLERRWGDRVWLP